MKIAAQCGSQKVSRAPQSEQSEPNEQTRLMLPGCTVSSHSPSRAHEHLQGGGWRWVAVLAALAVGGATCDAVGKGARVQVQCTPHADGERERGR